MPAVVSDGKLGSDLPGGGAVVIALLRGRFETLRPGVENGVR